MMAKRLKPFDELSDDELLELTDDDIAWYKQREALNQGIVIAPKPPPAPVKPDIKQDMSLYMAEGLNLRMNGEDLLFTDPAPIFAIHEILRKAFTTGQVYTQEYVWACGHRNTFASLPTFCECSTKATAVFSQPVFEQHRDALETYETEKNQWDELNNAWNKYQREVRDVASKITDKQKEIKSKRAKIVGLVAAWEQYRTLDEESAALVFFAKAYGTALEDLNMNATEVRDMYNKQHGETNVTEGSTDSQSEGSDEH